MRYPQKKNVDSFPERIRNFVKHEESVNGPMFGRRLQLKKDLYKDGEERPLFAVVEDDSMFHIAALMTPPYNLRHHCSPNPFCLQGLKTLTRESMVNQWGVLAVMAEKRLAESFAQEWNILLRRQGHEGIKHRIHELRKLRTHDYANGEFRQAGAQAFHVDCFGSSQPDLSSRFVEQKLAESDFFLGVDPLPVSMAARDRPTPNGESIVYVYTPVENRGRGDATSVVARLSKRILDDGKQFCCLYTDSATRCPTVFIIRSGMFPLPMSLIVNLSPENRFPFRNQKPEKQDEAKNNRMGRRRFESVPCSIRHGANA